ncbi:putative Fanconi anemia, partial [Globisporangium splendens]
MVGNDDEMQQLAQLVRMFRARDGDATHRNGSNDEDNATRQAFAIVSAIGAERMKAMLVDRLAAQTAVGQNQYEDHEFLDAFQAVFWALHAPSNVREGEQWRKNVFLIIIQSMHAQNAPNALAAAILSVLMRELHHLNVTDLPVIIEELVRGVLLCQQLQRVRPAEGLVVFYSIELLPQLLLRVAQCPLLELDESMIDQCSGLAYKDKVLAKLFALAWPKRFFLQVVKTFRDFNFNDDQERELCGKIFREVNREIFNEVRDGSNQNDNLESLPIIFYNVVLLIGRTKNEFCKRLLMSMLLRKCDAVAGSSAAMYAGQRSSTSHATSMNNSSSARELKVLLSTMMYHADLALKHDESIAKVFLDEYELRVSDLTSFDVGLLLTIATLEKYETRVSTFLVSKVTQSYTTERSSPGYAGNDSTGVATRAAFLDTIVNPQDGSWSPVTQRMVHFGFLLMMHNGGSQDDATAASQKYVTHMTPQNARLLFSSLSPLLKVRPNIKSFLILTLRKAMFRKDEESRMIAIIGFSFLLCLSSTVFRRSSTLTQLYSQNTTILLSQGVQDGSVDSEIATQEHANAVVAEDLYRQFCGIFKRAFQLQTRVRLVLYAELDKVFRECPTLRPSILELAFQHYLKYYDDNESILPPLKVDSCLARKRGLYEEPLGYLLHVLLICVSEIKKDYVGETEVDDMVGDDDIPATQTAGAQKSFDTVERNISVLMERMKRCELTDFEIDKNLSFAAQTAMGQSNQRLAKILLDIWEVCMNWTIVSFGGIKMDENTWGALIHYLEMHKWLKSRVKESEEKVKGSDGPDRKRGRPSSKQKAQEIQATTSEQGSSQQSSKDDDYASFFGEHASFSCGLLLSPSTIVSVLTFSLSKIQAAVSVVTRDDENLLLFMLEKAAAMVGLAQQGASSSSSLFNQKGVLVGESRILIDRLGAIVFGIFYVCHTMEVPNTSGTGKRTAKDAGGHQSLLAEIRYESLRVFGVIVGVWMTKANEEASDCLAFALSNAGFQDEDELIGDGDATKLENCATAIQTLFDAMMLKNMVREGLLVLDIVKAIWCKTPARLIGKYESWMKRAILRNNFSSQKLLESMVHMFLRPHPEIGLLTSLALQLTKGLLHYCNGGDRNGDATEHANVPDRLNLDRFDEKCILTSAAAVLLRCEDATSELEGTVKEFDAQQRRQTMKLKEDESISCNYWKMKQLCGILMPFVMMDLNKIAVSIRVIRLIGRLYKLLVVMVNCKLRRKDSSLPKYLQRLFDRVASELTPTLLQYIACIHEEGKRAALTGTLKAKAKQSNATAQSKLIPDVIFQIEQFDVTLIKLSKLCKVRYPFLIWRENERDFSQWIRLRQSRDFRFNRDLIKKQMRVDEAEKRRYMEAGEAHDSGNEDTNEEVLADTAELSDNVETESAEDGDTYGEEEEAVGSARKRSRQQVEEDNE